ncbi:type IX secretion system membrane protein PorP/SprF [Chitinophaga sp.]|uniref:PorP/SprF family type IX secretion system membrane protein n=1 Tax=Chitinophaga sp. TaxID=1869181 RepID=UPI0031D7143C
MRSLILCLFLIAALHATAQQDVQFSQYIFNGLSVNPAYAGYKGTWYLNTIARQQWTGLPGAPRTGGVSIDGPLRNDKDKAGMGLGVQVMADRLGPQQSYSLYASYAFSIPLNENRTKHLSFGLGVGAVQYHLDGNNLQYFDAEDAVFPGGGVNTISPDARFGIYYHAPSFYLSVSALDLFSNYLTSDYKWKGYNYENIRKTMHLYLSTGFMASLSDQVKLKPSIMIKDDLKGPTNIDINAMLLIERVFWIGGSYRTALPVWRKSLPSSLSAKNAASAIVEYYINDTYRIGYAYDFNINELANAQSGSHEISIGILFRSKKYSVSSPRYF